MSVRTIYNAAKDYWLPDIDPLSLIFDYPLSLSTDDTVLHIEAGNTANCVTKAQCRTYTKRIAHALREGYGIGANSAGKDVVACISSGQVLLPSVFYGVIAAGGVYSAASSSLTVAELARQLEHGGCQLLITSQDCKSIALQAAEKCAMSPSRVLVLDSRGGKRHLAACSQETINLLEQYPGQLQWEKVSDPAILKSRTSCLIYSSGTTGEPKGVRISHQNLVSSAMVNLFTYRDYISRQKTRSADFHPEYRTIAHLPAAHIAGCQGYFIQPALCGGAVYWMPKFDFQKFLAYCKEYRVTFFFTVPPIFQLIVQSSFVTDQFQYLIHAVSGAAPMGPDLVKKSESKLGCAVTQTWGLSETTGSVTVSPWDAHIADGSVSPLVANIRLRVVDDSENNVSEGEIGEFVVQGPMVTQGYWNNQKASKESFTADGAWFKTGDLGYCMDGKIFIVDRKKEMIKYKGLQVAPAELEALLLSHSHIRDAAVVGVPDPDMEGNELPRAYVVADPSQVTETMIKGFVKANLASHKQLRGGVVFLEAIPKSPTGKILRRQLRDVAKASRGLKL
ncbi:4-coumarate-CoA ligase [Aspergillus nomiae NRRL 13137]|uniref:4-coumarate-CoA ligase n=1 Tax=Aspergillus nomiae NRRL (strain ATCC 15546 / NRRL 13137 / CBS 260.88 / M93) TaxID=1509407 RepID=A0A0L1ITH1_ASPN3|nr:4-coumarate-CoA ligase [Aspergillus nomiae NRRL 13137]KNG82458.1 4-coumarate-CoA ligase [Aspergillus nomiae NRRL 13137]